MSSWLARRGRNSDRILYASIGASTEHAGDERLLTEISRSRMPGLHQPLAGVTIGDFGVDIPASHRGSQAVESVPAGKERTSVLGRWLAPRQP